jgi:hypothetical protein
VIDFLGLGWQLTAVVLSPLGNNNNNNNICSKLKSETRYWAQSKNRGGQVSSLLPMCS